jgi:hypothetical protein
VTAYPDPVATLHDPEVRKYFVALLNSSLPAEEKYQAFLRFFELESDLSSRLQSQGDSKSVDEAVADAARKAGAWQPETILEPTRDTLERALRRIERSQHSDGGWGYEVERSHPWATAWTVLCLHRAASLSRDGSLGRLGASPALVERGLQWLIDHRDRWSIHDAPANQSRSLYETAVALRCLCETGAADRPDVKPGVEACLAHILKNQRPEGDWDATLWSGPLQRSASREEVGATSFALQALAASRRQDGKLKSAVLAGMEWLRRAQRPDGSWNASIYLPHTPAPVPSVNKTCDGLKGFLAGRRLGLDLAPYQPAVDKAVKWLLEQEQAVIGDDGKITGWGWKDDAAGQGQTLETKTERDLLENTCLTLETLLEIETVALPLLASNALWLIRKQWRGDGGDDGKWSTDDTGRTAFALLEFYCRIKDSPIFQSATFDAPAPSAAPERKGTVQGAA